MRYTHAGDLSPNDPAQVLFDSPELILTCKSNVTELVFCTAGGFTLVGDPTAGGVVRLQFTPAARPAVIARFPTGEMTVVLDILFRLRSLPATLKTVAETTEVLAADTDADAVKSFLAQVDAFVTPPESAT